MRVTVKDEIAIPNPAFAAYYAKVDSYFEFNPDTGEVSEANGFDRLQDFVNTQFTRIGDDSWVSGWITVVPDAIDTQVYLHKSETQEVFVVYMWKIEGRIVSSGIHSG